MSALSVLVVLGPVLNDKSDLRKLSSDSWISSGIGFLTMKPVNEPSASCRINFSSSAVILVFRSIMDRFKPVFLDTNGSSFAKLSLNKNPTMQTTLSSNYLLTIILCAFKLFDIFQGTKISKLRGLSEQCTYLSMFDKSPFCLLLKFILRFRR
ncbi:hypothetical protein BpHYR1_017280 [Brachionus plicatilis]|uniref:Uncharacterized protein n=1 Tax=Brachionus plicatilis TaxID=10195 RepID=A0A3M7P9V7_BRAPC|nr:hypothetical protein BpHYR1_017280 [Brachionus plicatilis]